MTRKTVLIGALVAIAALITIGAMTDAQEVKLGDSDMMVNGSPVLTAGSFGLTGTIYTTSSTLGPNTAGPIFTAPATGNFVLTQLCTASYDPSFGVNPLAGSTLGPIAYFSENCNLYWPGFAIPQNEIITAENAIGSNVFVYTFTGVLQP